MRGVASLWLVSTSLGFGLTAAISCLFAWAVARL